MKRKIAGYIVMYDDNDEGYVMPMGDDPDCEGAIQLIGPAASVFATRADARKAIEISVRKARLDEAQGKPVNTDFTAGRKHLRVVPLIAWAGVPKH